MAYVAITKELIGCAERIINGFRNKELGTMTKPDDKWREIANNPEILEIITVKMWGEYIDLLMKIDSGFTRIDTQPAYA